MASERPPTRRKRFFALAGMTAAVAGEYAKSRVKGVFQSAEQRAEEQRSAHRRSGERIAETLGELKGAVMKVGQMASIASDVLPRELSDALGRLQKQAPPMGFDVIAQQIEAELGAPPEQLFRSFERHPFASASIGQVHRARLDDGRDVVCKVQYPGVDGAVDSDLSHLKLALRASGLATVSREALDATFKEVRERLHEELDYCNEADNLRRFAEFHRRHAFVRIPEVIGERSAQRVLTLSFEQGHHLEALDVGNYTQATRDLLGRNLLEFMLSEIFEFGCIHADPNPGNFGFRHDGTVVVYDFGCVKQLDPAIVLAYAGAMRAGLDEDYDALESCLQQLGLRNRAGPEVEASFYKQWRDAFVEPVLAAREFDYAASTIHESVMRLIPGSVKRVDSFKPAPELVFLDRMIVGHYGNLRRLRARVPVAEMVRGRIDACATAAM